VSGTKLDRRDDAVTLIARCGHYVVRTARRFAAEAARRWVAFGELWRRSLQVRVVTSTLALSTAVVFVLGMVLQNEIINRLVYTKQQAGIAQTGVAQRTVSAQLRGADSSTDNMSITLATALAALTTQSAAAGSDQQQAASSAAGGFVPILVQASRGESDAQVVAVGPYANVPVALRVLVQSGQSGFQMTTVSTPDGPQIFLVVGTPISTTLSPPVQLYLMFPLSSEQSTISVVQGTLLLGGLVLVLLLAGITNLVIRQVVRPVRNAAEIAERFADGHLDERMRVIGEDDVARLAESYNSMAESIQAQIHQLEDFGQLQRRFTSDVSHELRTPLTTVRMAADVLHASREQFPAGLSRSTELLVDELDRFEALLGDLLEISRLDAGVEELASEQVDVRGLARSAVNSVQGLIESTTTRIVLELPDTEATAEVDSRRVERILRNLLANAVDHGEGLPVRLTVASGHNAIAVTVRDYGVGLRTGEGDLVFNRFWRADPSRNRRTGGTGLGLAISVEDARLHGGWLQAWGEPGKGACFRLTLPTVPNAELTDSPLPLPPLDAPGAGPPAPVAPQPKSQSQPQPPSQPPPSAGNGTDLSWRPTEVTEITVRNASNEVVEVVAGGSDHQGEPLS
jgi:two-component system, OmpR family, sensor histidine kinase MtrB